MTTSQIQIILDRLGGVEQAIADVKSDVVSLTRLVTVLDDERIGREAVQENADKNRMRRRDLFSMGASAAAIGGAAASVVWLVFQAVHLH